MEGGANIIIVFIMAVIDGVLSTVLLALCLNSLRVEGTLATCTKVCENLCYYNTIIMESTS